MFPEVPSTRPSASICFAVASTASGVVVGESATVQHLRVGQVGRHFAPHQRGQPLGHEQGVVGLGVVGGPAYVGREHDVGHPHQRVVGGERLALEVVEAGGG